MAGEKLVKRKDTVVVYGTGESKYLKTGQKYGVHKELAAKLIAKGHATETAPDPNADSVEGKKGKGKKGGTE